MTSRSLVRGPARAAFVALLLAVLAGGCTIPPLETPSPDPSPVPTSTPSPTLSPPTPTPSPTATATPAAIPDFAAGEIVASRIDGLRVRQRPALTAQIVTNYLLPLGAEMEVVMGPFPNDGLGWYLVTDADPAEPDFEEGWVGAGYEPDAFLGSTGRSAENSVHLASLAGRGDAEEGPVTIGDGAHAIRWIAADPESIGCRFSVSLSPVGGEPVPAIRATVGSGIDRGTLQPQTFAALGVRGPVFLGVASDCDWALALVRVPSASPSPRPSGSP